MQAGVDVHHSALDCIRLLGRVGETRQGGGQRRGGIENEGGGGEGGGGGERESVRACKGGKKEQEKESENYCKETHNQGVVMAALKPWLSQLSSNSALSYPPCATTHHREQILCFCCVCVCTHIIITC